MTSKDADHHTLPEILSNTTDSMKKALASIHRDISSLRTGRASPAVLDKIIVEYYGTPTPLNQLASISVPEAQLLVIQPWDKGTLQEIEKSIMSSDLGLNPSNDGDIIRVPIAPLSQERRHELIRVLKSRSEDGKVSVRNIRRNALDELRSAERNKTSSQDDVRKAQGELQKITDVHIHQIDELSSVKEEEILQV